MNEAKILVVDDQAENRYLLEVLLKSRGFEVVPAENGVEALAKLREEKIDLIISDILMPVMDGYRLCRECKSDATLKNIPFVFLTSSYTDEKDEQFALSLGADRYIRRPLESEALLGNIEAVIQEHREGRKVAPSIPPKEEAHYLTEYSERVFSQLERKVRELEAEIAKRKQAEKEQLEEVTFSNMLVDGLPGVFFLLDLHGRFVRWNKNLELLQGRPTSEMSGADAQDFICEQDRHLLAEKVRETFQNGRAAAELRILRKSGETRHYVFTSNLFVRDEAKYVAGFGIDITERKNAEETLRETRDYLENLFNHANAPVIVWNPSYQITMFNHAFEHLTGRKADEVIGEQIDILFPDDRKDEVLPLIRQTQKGERWETVEIPILHSSGAVRTALWNSATLYSADGKTVVATMAQGQDITERKQAEEALRKVNRALKTLSACNHTLAHSNSEERLLNDMCRVIIEQGGYLLAWVGYAQADEAKSLEPVAQYAVRPGYLDEVVISWGENPAGSGPAGTSVRSRQTQIIRHIATDPSMAQWRDKALDYGYQSIIALPLHADGGIIGTLAIYAAEPNAFDTEEVVLLKELGGDLAYGIQSLRTRIERDHVEERNRQYLDQISTNLTETIQAIAATVEMRDPYTAGHEKRVAELSVAIGQELGMAKEQLDGLRIAGTVHDVGKIRIPAEILSKPLRLNELEYGLIKLHPEAGYEILKGINFPWPIATIVWQHHERLDGSGYPRGLKGSTILLEAQILAVADVVESIVSHRPYRPALGLEAAFGELTEKRGKLYNADAVDACIRLFREKGFMFP
ncbi:MAG TPA: HD domain-containing phosphohydrolase [Gallionella sp.]|nr:HD domain-containing phosphohydrolase [Gallionella sp.]